MAKQTKQDQAPTPEATMVEGEHNPFVHALLTQAQSLSEELRGKGGLYERIDANRTTLRQIKTTGLLSEEQAKAIDEFYPVRKSKGEGEGSEAPAEATAA